jgi:hypothetical protein|nr:MAG TPA: protein of unknown function (DUF4190) [Caudoviricetes sp.]
MANNEQTEKSGLCTAGLVLGIIGVCTSFVPIINNLSFIMGVLAVIFGIVSIKKAGKGKMIATIVLGVLAIMITLNAQKTLSDSLDDISKDLDTATGKNTEQVLGTSVDVVLGNFEVTKKQYGINETKLPVKVTNKTTETKSFSIQIEAVSQDGTRITTDYIYANNLTAGQSQEFKVFEYVQSEILEKMKNAKFNIVEVSMH